MRFLARVMLLAAAFAAATWVLGWWAVPAVAAVWPWIAPSERHAPWEATLGALLAWGGLLLWTAATGPLGELLRRVSQIFMAPPAAMIAATLVFGTLLAWSAATVAGAIAGTGDRS